MLQRQQREGRSRRPGAGRAWVLLALAALLLSAAGVSAQEQALTVHLAGLTADDWPRAQAVVTVLDSDDRPVPDLTEAHLQAQLDNSPVPVVAVTRGVDSSLAVAVVLALDVSGSMQGGALKQAKAAAGRFLQGLEPEDSVALLTFNDTVHLVQPFTQDRMAAAVAVNGLTAGGGTTLYQATAESVRLAAAADSSRRAVVLLSDGLDNGSDLSRADALTTAETLSVPIFAIGLGADIDRDYLQELAQMSGGQFAETPSPEGLAQIYQEAGELLRGQYILTLDASALALAESEAATLRVTATVGEQVGSDERAVCPQRLCVALSEVEDGERLEEERTVVAQVVSEDPVASVTFLVDGEPVLELTDPPYQFTFDPASFSGGDHTLAAEATTSADETRAREITVRTGAGGGGIGSTYLVIAVILIAAVGGALLLLYLRRGRRGGEDKLGELVRPEPPSEALATEGPRRPLWEEEPPPPPPAPQEAQGRLYATSGPLAGQTFPVGNAPVSIGSGHRCLVRLPEQVGEEQEIASEHARVWIRDGHLMKHEVRRLTETGAVGGRWEILTPGDVFAIGPCTFRFELAAEEAAGPTDEEASSGEVPNILRDPADRPGEQARQSASGPPEASASEEAQEQGPGAPLTAEGGDPQDALPQFRKLSPPQPEE